ncbi:ribonuclease domain-containing protein [Kitasatospora sp. LaBMicrA B282]|uniref:ribonuclease domain-containing protein n=1 Tax=Kitasatospora sp. LaBMicrA B282 TaxID=3420949 RepID=UPI003D0EE069
MLTLTRLVRLAALGTLTSTLFLASPGTAGAQTAPHRSLRSAGEVCYSQLPAEAHDTLDLIDHGGPFPYSRDGIVFTNSEGALPRQSADYYHEYTVITPGAPTRGARRIVTGQGDHEDYYTADHYATFAQVDWAC